MGGPGIILSPGGGGGGSDLTQYEHQLVEKDFMDKSHTLETSPAVSIPGQVFIFSTGSTGAN